MEIATVIGHIWATKKEDSLVGSKLMIVKTASGASYVAADIVGAGIGEQVLVVSGSTARRALGSDNTAIDCAIVGIIDSIEVAREQQMKDKAGKKEDKQ